MSIATKTQAPGVEKLVASPIDAAIMAAESHAEQSMFVQDCLAIAKPRLSILVLLSVVAGFVLATPAELDLMRLLHAVLGTALVAIGSGALNQVLERKTDALMERTKNRPLATGRMNPGSVLLFGAASSIAGLLYLAVQTNLDTSLLAAVTLLLYVFVYTPLKAVTPLNTLVGAVPGALPPLIGWAAVAETADLNIKAWSLFMILFIWQLPHFLAIAWIYRHDYSRAGLQMWPTVDPDGDVTGRQVVVQSLLLLPLSLLPCVFRLSGPLYLLGAAVLGLAFLAFGINFAVRKTDRAARQLFLASVIYLPLVLGLMMYDRL
ncbi:MAG TPA: heme o synthase [Planctomycetota bacterium]|nr:heme o synthase [Planctomycetota bacterium]